MESRDSFDNHRTVGTNFTQRSVHSTGRPVVRAIRTNPGPSQARHCSEELVVTYVTERKRRCVPRRPVRFGLYEIVEMDALEAKGVGTPAGDDRVAGVWQPVNCDKPRS